MAASDRPSTENRDEIDTRPVILKLEDGGAMLYDRDNHRAWIQTTAAADVVP